MILCDGYLIRQEKNRIIINLPQTWETLSTTAAPVSDRKKQLTAEEEATILCIVKAMFERKEE